VDPDPGEDLGERGAAAAVVDGVGDAEVHGDSERGRRGVPAHLVPEVDLSLEQVLAAVAPSHRER